MKKILPLILLTALLTGCGGSGGAAYSTNDTMAYAGSADYNSFDGGYGVYEEAVPDAEVTSEQARYEEKLVYTCNMNIETLNYDESVSSIKDKIREAGGFIAYENEYDNEYGWYYADHVDSHDRNINIQARIPSNKYDAFVNSLSGDGKITSRFSSVDNISREYYDTEAVIESLKIQEDRLLDMMDSAETIEDMIAVEDRLTKVQMQLNQYKTSLSVMQTDVDYSTVNINVSEVYEYTPDENNNTFFNRLKNTIVKSVHDFGDILENLLFFVILAIPRVIVYVPVITLIVIAVKKIKAAANRRKTRKNPGIGPDEDK